MFEHARVSDHPVLEGVPSPLRVPHSRWNELPEDALTSCGYVVLTRSATAGVDMFLKQQRSLAIFFQGHPEYESETLLREYRRDIGRYLRKERMTYPAVPEGYVDEGTTRLLMAFRERAMTDRREDLLAEFPAAVASAQCINSWRSAASHIYRNWLSGLLERKSWQSRSARPREGLRSTTTR